MTTETLVWHIADRKPDAEITVLCWRQRIAVSDTTQYLAL